MQTARFPGPSSRKVRIIQVGQPLLGRLWDLTAPFVAEAAERGGSDSAEFFAEQVHSGAWQFWMVLSGADIKGVVLTRLSDTLRGKIAIIEVCAGRDLKDWIHLIADIEAWARKQGCVGVEAEGRVGFERLLGPTYKKVRVALYKEI